MFSSLFLRVNLKKSVFSCCLTLHLQKQRYVLIGKPRFETALKSFELKLPHMPKVLQAAN